MQQEECGKGQSWLSGKNSEKSALGYPAQKLRVDVDRAARMAARLGANGHDLRLHLDGLGMPVQVPLRVQ